MVNVGVKCGGECNKELLSIREVLVWLPVYSWSITMGFLAVLDIGGQRKVKLQDKWDNSDCPSE